MTQFGAGELVACASAVSGDWDILPYSIGQFKIQLKMSRQMNISRLIFIFIANEEKKYTELVIILIIVVSYLHFIITMVLQWYYIIIKDIRRSGMIHHIIHNFNLQS